MFPTLLHIWGPLSVHSFGCMIALGSIICLKLLQRDKPLMKLISRDQVIDIALVIFGASFVGGRLLYVWEIYDGSESFIRLLTMPNSGFAIMGSVITSVLVLVAYLNWRVGTVLPVLDRFAIYMPLLYSISRIGCFLAGCCYGIATSVAWAVKYTNADVYAPCHVWIHPTQLYSATWALFTFLIFYFVLQRAYAKYEGMLTASFLTWMSMERFFVDFYRVDRTGLDSHGISIMQWWCIGIYVCGLVLAYWAARNAHFFTKNKGK